jgi:DNA-binding transcriptional LysR family regulator
MYRLRLLDGRLKIRHLVLVDALTRHGSVIGAAAALDITQPVATRTLQELEALLGVSLFERGPRGVTPTTIGGAFTGHARAVLAQLSQAGLQVTEFADPDRGTVVVGTYSAGSHMLLAQAHVLLAQAIAGLKSERPLLTVIVRENSPEALSAELEAGNIDLIVGQFTSPTTGFEVRTPLYDECIEICTRTQHPLAQRRRITFPDLSDYAWIVPSAETPLRYRIEQLFALHAMPLPANRIEAPSGLILRQLLLEGDFIGALPGPIELYAPGLRPLPLSFEPIERTVGITTSAGRALSACANALIQRLQAIATQRLDGEPEAAIDASG